MLLELICKVIEMAVAYSKALQDALLAHINREMDRDVEQALAFERQLWPVMREGGPGSYDPKSSTALSPGEFIVRREAMTNAVAVEGEAMTVEKMLGSLALMPEPPNPEFPTVGQVYIDRENGGAMMWNGDVWIALTAKAANAILRDFPEKVTERRKPGDPNFDRKLDID